MRYVSELATKMRRFSNELREYQELIEKVEARQQIPQADRMLSQLFDRAALAVDDAWQVMMRIYQRSQI